MTKKLFAVEWTDSRRYLVGNGQMLGSRKDVARFWNTFAGANTAIFRYHGKFPRAELHVVEFDVVRTSWS